MKPMRQMTTSISTITKSSLDYYWLLLISETINHFIINHKLLQWQLSGATLSGMGP